MKICKDPEGYFILDDANQKVTLLYQGKTIRKVPTIMHLGLCFWVSNEKGSSMKTPFETLVTDIAHFKAIKYAVLNYLIEESENEN